MRVIYMGTPEFAVGPLEALIQSRHEVLLAVTQPDRPKGRGKAVQFPPVKEKALEYQIPVIQPEKVKAPEVIEQLEAYQPDLIVVAAFGQILPKKILNIPKYGCVNIHASLLPKYRGAAPIQWAVINGEKESGVTTMMMSSGLDKGDMLLKASVLLDPKETGDSLHDKLSVLGGPLLLKTMELMESGELTRIPQDDSKSSYASMLTKQMGQIDWTKSAVELERLIRGLNSWPCTYTQIHGKTVKIWEAEPVAAAAGMPGEILPSDKNSLLVKTGDQALSILSLQPEGKKRMSVSDYLRGYPLEAGEILG